MKNNYTMDRIKERQKLSAQGLNYSVQRMDLLIISISGAGVYVCLETLKYINDKQMEPSLIIKLAGVILLIAIILNFLSQFFGHRANVNDYLMCDAQLDAGEKISKKEQLEINNYDCKASFYDKATTYINYSSAIVMSIGLILLIIYFLITF